MSHGEHADVLPITANFAVERDLSEYRGTGGVLRDLTAEYDDDDLILVANAAQVLLEPLPIIAAELYGKKADVAVVAHEDGTPSGLMLIRCKALRQIAATGFVDMKGQALAADRVGEIRCPRDASPKADRIARAVAHGLHPGAAIPPSRQERSACFGARIRWRRTGAPTFSLG